MIARPAPRRERDRAQAPAASPEREARRAPSGAGASSGRSGYRDDGLSAEHAPSAYPSTDNLGTEYGESLTSSVEEVAFRRANPKRPEALITLRYDDRAGLLARGIALEPRALARSR